MGMLKLLVQGEEDVRARRLHPQAEVFSRIERKLASQKATR
jgi:hypothetical protein